MRLQCFACFSTVVERQSRFASKSARTAISLGVMREHLEYPRELATPVAARIQHILARGGGALGRL